MSQKRHSYELLGQEVGLECLSAILGVGKKRVLKCQKGLIDMRYGEQMSRLSPKSLSVDRFLLDLYGTVAETLPTQNPVSIKDFRDCYLLSTLERRPIGTVPEPHPAIRFIQPNRPSRQLKEQRPLDEVLHLSCQLQDERAIVSDDDHEFDGDNNDPDVTLPPEQISQDLDLAAEMELDQQLWFRRAGLKDFGLVFVACSLKNSWAGMSAPAWAEIFLACHDAGCLPKALPTSTDITRFHALMKTGLRTLPTKHASPP